MGLTFWAVVTFVFYCYRRKLFKMDKDRLINAADKVVKTLNDTFVGALICFNSPDNNINPLCCGAISSFELNENQSMISFSVYWHGLYLTCNVFMMLCIRLMNHSNKFLNPWTDLSIYAYDKENQRIIKTTMKEIIPYQVRSISYPELDISNYESLSEAMISVMENSGIKSDQSIIPHEAFLQSVKRDRNELKHTHILINNLSLPEETRKIINKNCKNAIFELKHDFSLFRSINLSNWNVNQNQSDCARAKYVIRCSVLLKIGITNIKPHFLLNGDFVRCVINTLPRNAPLNAPANASNDAPANVVANDSNTLNVLLDAINIIETNGNKRRLISRD